MPSLADLLGFWLRPSTTFGLGPGSAVPPWFPDATSLDAGKGSDSDPLSIENLPTPGGEPSGNTSDPQLEIPTFPTAAPFPSIAPQISTGGYLEGIRL